MATVTGSNLCSICSKPSARRFCIGCKKYFCPKDFKEHEQQLSIKFDNEIVRSHDGLLDQIQKLEKSNSLSLDLSDQIEKWKNTTISKVKKAAEKAQRDLNELIDKQRTTIIKQLEPITKEIRCRQEEENFVENDIDELRQKINEIQQNLEQFTQKDATKTIRIENDQIDWNRLIYIREEQQNRYSGLHCDIKQTCSCSPDSFCLTSSICVCPLKKYGPKCYLKHSICQSSNNSCENDGLCVSIDDCIASNKFTCLCKESFYESRCENAKNRIYIKLDEKILEGTTVIFVHYITAFEDAKHQHITTLKKIKHNEIVITLFVTYQFNILIAEVFNKNYYLLVLRERFIESEDIQTKLLSNQRCAFIDELLNTTFRSYSRLHRIKYILSCFVSTR
ncbi:unnamed protein product [Rotaria sp. Silwood2]|nr:unnamed protein product [Rotaria sp. Silwood2]